MLTTSHAFHLRYPELNLRLNPFKIKRVGSSSHKTVILLRFCIWILVIVHDSTGVTGARTRAWRWLDDRIEHVDYLSSGWWHGDSEDKGRAVLDGTPLSLSFPTWEFFFSSSLHHSIKKLFDNSERSVQLFSFFFSGRLCFFSFSFSITSDLSHNLSLSFSPIFFLKCTELNYYK